MYLQYDLELDLEGYGHILFFMVDLVCLQVKTDAPLPVFLEIW